MLQDLLIGKSVTMLEIDKLMSGESEKTPDIIDAELEQDTNELNNIVLQIESALEDLKNGKHDKDMLEKYEELTGESAISSIIIDNWVEIGKNIIDRILLYIKKLYDNAIIYLKKIYIKNSFKNNKYRDELKELKKKYNPSNKDIEDNLFMFIDDNMADVHHFDNMVLNSLSIGVNERNIHVGAVERVDRINKFILINLPKRAVFTDYLDKGINNPANDMLDNYRSIIEKNFLKEINRNFDMFGLPSTLQLNLPYTNIKDVNTSPIAPLPIITDGIETLFISMDVDGRMKVGKCNLKYVRPKHIELQRQMAIIVNEIISRDFDKDIEEDFKYLDKVKRNADAYLNVAKRYHHLDGHALAIYGNNVTTTLTLALNLSINRIRTFKNIINVYKEN